MSQVVLHISDVHFSEEKTHDNDARSLALSRLIQTVLDQPADWQPGIVCLTGDIAKRGKSADYQVADAWLNMLLSELRLSKDALFICPGNHDVDREFAKQLARPTSSKEADDILQFPPITQPYSTVFGAYARWAAQFGVKPYKLGEYENYLVGHRVYGGLSFVAFNTAWNCKDDDDKERLWLGLPQVRHLEAKGQFPLLDGDRSSLPITVVLLHHPKNWLHPDESRAAGMRPSVWDYVAYRTDIVLSGHTHEEVRRGDTIAETALHFSCGATYEEKYYFNNFRLLRIEGQRVSYKTFEFSSRTPDLRWQSSIASAVSFPKRSSDSRLSQNTQTVGVDIALLRERTRAHASRILQQKSRAVKPEGDLPNLTPLTVAVKVRQEKHSEADARSNRDVPQLLLAFEDALKKSRRTLLLGELGTGKSTLAAGAVETIQNKSDCALAFLIPAKQLTLPSKLTAGNLIDAFSKFVSESVAPALGPIDLRDLLKAKFETTIILDGLDELDSNRIASLLNEFAVIPEHWETISVVATGRPIEMSGTTYAEWQAVTTTVLDDEKKRTIFENEALAEGRSFIESREHAIKLLTRLRKTPALSRVISTPLALRLFYHRLSNNSMGEAVTLGDLVLEVIHERLTGWAKKDDKHSTTEFFEKYFPEADSRIALLAKIALQVGAKEHLQVSDVRQMLAAELKDLGVASVPCATEALAFFSKTGLLVADDSVQFPVSLFYQVLTGIGLEALWSSKVGIDGVSVGQWREVSFAASVARRKRTLARLVPQFEHFISNLSAHDSFVPMAAYIITESKSTELAKHFIQQAEAHRTAAIRFFEDEWDESARVIAEALKIAGSAGFDWFYNKYLNPKYPFVQGGSFLIGAVFREWVRLSIGNVTPGEKQQIEQMVVPILKANTMQVHDIVASAVFLIPEAFDDSERLAFITQGLTTTGLSEFAEPEVKRYMQSEKRQLCERFLLSAGSPSAALLWLDYNAGIPRSEILITAVRSLTDWQGQHADRLVTICEERIGKERWMSFVRLALFHADTKVSVGAALALYDAGEKESVLLRTPLVRALHDGGYVRRAEQVLDSLLSQPGVEQEGLKWLAKVIHDHSQESDLTGGHSGEFRLFLKRLPNAKDGPSLLAWAIIGLGQFVLPRYPEVRQLFRDLFEGSRGPEYREAFRQRLRSWNGVERRAVAAVLVTSLPDEESLGLQTIVRSLAGGYGMRWHEWEDYLLSINFGLAPLTALKSVLPGFPKEAARFGYRLLLNNNIDLNEDEQTHALEGILERPYRIRETEIAFLKSDKAKSKLLDLARASDGELRRESAQQLVRFHESSLGLDDLVLCAALTIVGLRWNRNTLADQLEKLRTDPQYSRAVEELGIAHTKEHSTPLLLDLLRRSLNDSTVWDDLVWELMCKERVPWDLEDPGMWLLEAGSRDTATGIAIAKAAEKCLSESQKRPLRSDDVHQWLTVIADEFVGVPKQELEKRVIASPIHREATAALLFRLGTIPNYFKRSQSSHGFIPAEPVPFSEVQLRDASRQTEGLPENLCERLLSTVVHRAVKPDEIESSKQLGSNGALIASVLAFTQGFPPSPEYVVLTLPLRATYKHQRQGCLVHLLNICNVSQYERLKADPRTRSALLSAVQKAFTDIDNVAEAASLLLELREYLTGKEAQRLFDSVVERAYRTDYVLQEQTVRWFSRIPIDFPGELPETLAAINSALARVSERAPEKSPFTLDEAIVDMSLALGAWRLSDRDNLKATEAYWRGLRILFRMKGNDALSPLADAFQILEPLLVSVNPDLLRSAISSRNLDPDPVVRASFVIFKAFGGMKA